MTALNGAILELRQLKIFLLRRIDSKKLTDCGRAY